MADTTSTDLADDIIPDENDRPAKQKAANKVQPLFEIYQGSKLPVGKAVGPMWQKRFEAARHAHSLILEVWEECFKYYNHHQGVTLQTERGAFKRGDGTENIIYSNLNVTLPAVYSKNPDVSCSTVDGADEPFCQALQALINQLLRRADQLAAKPKVKRATGLGLLTNLGILKLDFTKKDDSRELALQQMEAFTQDMAKADTPAKAEAVWGKFQALEENMETRKPSGFELSNVLPHNLIIDPNAEQPDGSDAEWMIERCWMPTGMLTARYTQKGKEGEGRVLAYKPTHKAVFAGNANRDDGLGLVLSRLSADEQTEGTVTGHTYDERRAYIEEYFSECYFVWDKLFRRVYLFHRDDWSWPIWVWDDPLGTTRFFPYFFISFSFNTGGMVTVGDIAYILDQQDHINDINRQATRIRRAVFDFFFYDRDAFDQQDVEKLVSAIRGETSVTQHAIGLLTNGKPVKDMIEAYSPPAEKYKELFDKAPLFDTINRQTNTSDAIRGVQFKTNTNVEAVNTYQQSMMLSVGAKVDSVEDCMTNLCGSVAEIAVREFDKETVAGFIGEKLSQQWQQMGVAQFAATYSVEITPGSMEKPTSQFKKKEAIEIVQAVGQFAKAAPGMSLKIMLRVLSKAFTEVNIKPEDWEALSQEIDANLQRGNSTGGQPGQPGQEGGGQENAQQMQAQIEALPPEIQKKLMDLHKAGVSGPQFIDAVHKAIQSQQGQQPNMQQPNQGQRPPAQASQMNGA